MNTRTVSAYARPALAAPTRASGIWYGRLVLYAFVALLIGSAMDAYSVGPVPVEWLTYLAVIAITFLVGLAHRLYLVPGSKPLLVLIPLALGITVYNAVTFDFAALMPQWATMPYPGFVTLRFFMLGSFISMTWLVYWLLVNGYRDALIRSTVLVAAGISAIALYIYVAQVYGWPEPPRTRIGTVGGEQITRFTYAFHRAMGTFREPSHLAQWLTAPFFFSLVYGRNRLNLYTILIGGALLLTGSLTGILSVTLAFMLSLLLSNPFRLRNMGTLIRLGLVGVLAFIIFESLVAGYGNTEVSLFRVITERVEPILLEGGLRNSNRGFVYNFVEASPAPWLGYGLGNANLILTSHIGEAITASYLSLYLNVLYSTGFLGLVLLVVFLARPVLRYMRRTEVKRQSHAPLILAAYLCYLIVFAVHIEELSFMFAMVYALLSFEAHEGPVEKAGTADVVAPTWTPARSVRMEGA